MVSFTINGQQSKTDSLVKAISTSNNDSLRIILLNELSETLRSSNPDSSLSTSLQAIAIARKKKFSHLRLMASIQLAATYDALSQTSNADSAFKLLIKEAKLVPDSIALAEALIQKGIVLNNRGNPYDALLAYDKCLTIRKKLKDSVGLSHIYNNIANVYTDLGKYSQALDLYQQALYIDQAINNKNGISNRLNNIARIYSFKGEHDKALEYFKESYQLSIELGDSVGQRIRSNNIGYAYKQQGKYREALPYLYLSLAIQRNLNERCGIEYPMYNIGSIYQKIDRLDSSALYLNVAAEKAIECNNNYILCLSYIDLGSLNAKKQNYQKAETLIIQAYEKARQTGLKSEQKDAALLLSDVYEQQGKTNLALKYFKIYTATKDSIFNEETADRLAQLESDYEYRQQMREAEMNQQLQELENEKALTRAIWLRNTSIVGFLIMMFIAFLIYLNYHRKNKANQLLSDLNHKINAQKDKLAKQTEELKNAHEEVTIINENLEGIVKERTRTITEQNKKILEYVFYNSHQVRGPLARILGLVSLFRKNAVNSEEFQKNLRIIQQEAEELDLMVRNMNRTLEKEKIALRKPKNN